MLFVSVSYLNGEVKTFNHSDRLQSRLEATSEDTEGRKVLHWTIYDPYGRHFSSGTNYGKGSAR